jgi:hypothetical protein
MKKYLILVPFLWSCNKEMTNILPISNEKTQNNVSSITVSSSASQTIPVSSVQAFPDCGIAFLPPTSGDSIRMIFAAGVSSYLVQGNNLSNLNSVQKVLSPGAPQDYDNGYAGISGVYVASDGTYYGIYHSEDHTGMASLPGGVPGFYANICWAVSTDKGLTWTKKGILLSSRILKASLSTGDGGLGEPSLLIKNDSTALIYYDDHSRSTGTGVQICVAEADPRKAWGSDQWKKWDGVSFSQPALGGYDIPIISGGKSADDIFPYAVYSKYLNKFVMLYCMNKYDEFSNPSPTFSGLYIAFSDDGINWGDTRHMMTNYTIWYDQRECVWHPSLALDSDGKSGTLLYSFKPYGNNPHYMKGMQISFSK